MQRTIEDIPLIEDNDVDNMQIEETPSIYSSDSSEAEYYYVRPKSFYSWNYSIQLLKRSFYIFLVLFGITGTCNFITRKFPIPEYYNDTKYDAAADLLKSIPLPVSSKNGKVVFKIDFHSHTRVSDGQFTPQQYVDWAILNGFNTAFITDHNSILGGLIAKKYAETKYKGEFLVIPGAEYSNCRVHMNLLNLKKDLDYGGANPTDEEIRNIIRQTHDQDGLAIINHLPWSLSVEYGKSQPTLSHHPKLAKLFNWGLDGIEIINHNTYDKPSQDYVLKNKLNKLLVTGTDIHKAGSAYAWTIVEIMNSTAKFDTKTLLDHLKTNPRNLTHSFYPIGTAIYTGISHNPNYGWLLPIEIASDIFDSFFLFSRGMYSFHGSFCHISTLVIHYFGVLSIFISIFIILAILDLFCWLIKVFTDPASKLGYYRVRTLV